MWFYSWKLTIGIFVCYCMMVSAIILIIEGDCVKDIIDLDYTIAKDMFSDIDYV